MASMFDNPIWACMVSYSSVDTFVPLYFSRVCSTGLCFYSPGERSGFGDVRGERDGTHIPSWSKLYLISQPQSFMIIKNDLMRPNKEY